MSPENRLLALASTGWALSFVLIAIGGQYSSLHEFHPLMYVGATGVVGVPVAALLAMYLQRQN